jgi:uncharacterized protein (DUF2141 family)
MTMPGPTALNYVDQQMLSNPRAKGTRPADRACAPCTAGLCSNFELVGYDGGDRGLSPCGADDSVFAEGDLALLAFRAKLAAVAALALIFALAATLTGSLSQPAGKLSITVTGARNSDGVVRCALFNSPAAFPRIGQEWRGVIASIRGGAANCVFGGVPPGTYAVAFFHAEHNETQLTTGLFGKPQQGYGFSNNATGGLGPPNFSAAAFRYDGGNMTLQGSLTY